MPIRDHFPLRTAPLDTVAIAALLDALDAEERHFNQQKWTDTAQYCAEGKWLRAEVVRLRAVVRTALAEQEEYA